MTKVINEIEKWKELRASGEFKSKTIGFVPTMGALHAGHKSLIDRSVTENNITVVSVFVNPTQFNDKSDLTNYPKTFDEDLEMISNAGADYLLFPEYDSIYPDNYAYKVTEDDFSKLLCGASRPGHFDGVLTVVMKLFNIVDADRAYFGEKDYQQLKLIEGMAKAFFMKTEIIACPTIRDYDGLALSSRNTRLAPTERELAKLFPQILKQNISVNEAKQKLEAAGIKVDYITDINNRRYGAVFIGNVRLIDNVQI